MWLPWAMFWSWQYFGCHLFIFWKVKSPWPWTCTCGVLSVIWKGTDMYKIIFFSPHRDLMSQKKMAEHLQMKMRSHYMEKRRDGRKMKIWMVKQQNSHPRKEKKTHLPHDVKKKGHLLKRRRSVNLFINCGSNL